MTKTGAQLLTAAIVLLSACSSRNSAPVYDRTANRHNRVAESSTRIRMPSFYVVRPGDTLYAIAWRYGLDYKTLASWNGISSPFTIYVDQRLRLSRPRTTASNNSTGRQDTTSRSDSVKPTQSTTSRKPETRQASQANKPVRTDPQTAKQTTVRVPVNNDSGSRRPVTTQADRKTGPITWRWPLNGRILRSYSAGDESAKGLDISASRGANVVAAAAGEVVYSGRGLIGYGELIIIKHDKDFLSAYGHNEKRLVNEGDRVEIGQHIANVGSSGSDAPKLHFEIRVRGKPVNPVDYLPASPNSP